MNAVSYVNPPVKEAIFDVRFVFEGEVQMPLFDEIYQNIASDYPKKEILNQQFISFKVGNPAEADQVQSSGSQNGIRLTSVDGLHIVQFRTDGMTFSRLEPYSGWDLFSAEAEKMVALYINILKPKYISRLALRFINLLKIPEVVFDVEDYLNTEARLSDDIGANIKQFFMRQLIQSDSGELFAVINQTTADNQLPEDSTKIVFDIDVFKENINTQFNSDDYSKLLVALRDFRSEIFEKSITEKTRALFI